MSYNQSITLPVNPKVNIVPNQCSPPERDQPSPRTGIREDMLVFFSLQPRVRKCRGKEWNHLHIRFFLLIGLSGAVFTICVLLIQYLSGSDKFARQQMVLDPRSKASSIYSPRSSSCRLIFVGINWWQHVTKISKIKWVTRKCYKLTMLTRLLNLALNLLLKYFAIAKSVRKRSKCFPLF